jgi:DNA-directed RNA polymerase subunit K
MNKNKIKARPILQNLYKGELNIRPLPYGEHMKYTRFEKARIIGARALQISFGAPILIDYPADMLDSIDIAMLEFDRDMVPITVSRD